MTRLAQLPGLLALTGLLLTAINPPAHGQEGGKMLKKEGKTDDKLLRENRRMMRDGRVNHGQSLSKEPKLVREEDRLDHRQAPAPRKTRRAGGSPR
ncbi:hypothetical protein MON38_19690 [Hymenobacter sp. DH14]|uniref:Uncharacterized protein n=1 Tax=Hymenobacter cyanobacteriorum TaxID=2926463 RepID=A0A9X2AGW1_9BACT|nr:hypothetical protein [Hymenobacter cyanobacteriorum]MCI1189651.1 hypothetical protein [Hymenobacter cyanobacteriorum]